MKENPELPVVITLIASIAAMICTGGTSEAGSADKLLMNIEKLRDASPVADKIYKALKCMAYRTKLPKLIEKAPKVKRKPTKNKGKGGVSEVKTPYKIDNKGKKGYLGNNDGPEKTPVSFDKQFIRLSLKQKQELLRKLILTMVVMHRSC